MSILSQLPVFPTIQTYTQTCQMILALHALGLQTSRYGDNWPLPKEFIGTPINQILLDHPKASYFKEKLNNHKVFSVEQFLNATNTELLEWNNFHHNIKKIPRGRCPHWFHTIQDLIAGTTNPSSIFSQLNPHTLTS
ncbi:1538_t:CDS:1 [Ambispora leptoticha]|uniref:1537_t:CDS:1 n=1 Tax=Ambispora leptoticha TaxID=144679 RepID=A0A9N9B9A9_9GLOM|nr:1537_t:CDS:1 [Ambispora leptoticha]CAG8559895.1 1538_t:CDS:1 [Ambispora leptoticha]